MATGNFSGAAPPTGGALSIAAAVKEGVKEFLLKLCSHGLTPTDFCFRLSRAGHPAAQSGAASYTVRFSTCVAGPSH